MKNFKMLGMAAALALIGGTASAATLDTSTATPNDGILNFTGIDWHSNGTGYIQGFDLTAASPVGATDTFTFTFQAFAGIINGGSPTPNLYVSSPGSHTGSYELTTIATITETATCVNVGCSVITITSDSGTFNIWFDTSPDANQAAGTGFTDGALIISGNITAGSSTFSGCQLPSSCVGNGGAEIDGLVTFTNNAYVNPNLLGTHVSTTLRFPGAPPPNYTPAALVNGIPTVSNQQNFQLQTDANQDFTEASVPEPATLALLGLALVGLGWSERRSRRS